ncbi:DUF3429 domain-containing protein [Pseudoalteromonas xiamenensis]
MERYFNQIQMGYLGLLPFLFFVAWQLFTGADATAINMFSYYSMGILAFMAGSIWRPGAQSKVSAWLTVAVTIPFPLLALASPLMVLIYLSVAFWVVLLVEKSSPLWPDYYPDYRKMRVVLTSVVFVSHLFQIAMFLSLTTLK